MQKVSYTLEQMNERCRRKGCHRCVSLRGDGGGRLGGIGPSTCGPAWYAGGGSVDLPSPIHWRNEKYLPWKLLEIQYPLARSDDQQPLTVILENLDTADIYVSAVT